MEALTMRVLADEAQLSVPTVYALVGGWDDVIAASMAAAVRRLFLTSSHRPTCP